MLRCLETLCSKSWSVGCDLFLVFKFRVLVLVSVGHQSSSLVCCSLGLECCCCCCCNSSSTCTPYHFVHKCPHMSSTVYLGGVVVRSRTRDRQIMGSIPAVALSGIDLGQVIHTSVPLFTNQYKLVPCEGFHVDAPFVATMA